MKKTSPKPNFQNHHQLENLSWSYTCRKFSIPYVVIFTEDSTNLYLLYIVLWNCVAGYSGLLVPVIFTYVKQTNRYCNLKCFLNNFNLK